MIGIHLVTAGMLLAATVLVLWRIVAGPGPLDRIVAGDIMVAIVIAAVGLYAIVAGNPTGLPILLGLCLVGFTGAVGVARLLASTGSVRRLFDRRRAMREDDDDDA